jgi:hypothetical protein
MSVSKLARAGRIDSEASRLSKQPNTITSQLSVLVGEVNAFATFMQADPQAEFTQEDKDKYSDSFMASLGGIQAVLAGLTSLSQLEIDEITVEQFINQSPTDPLAYSSRFDKG